MNQRFLFRCSKGHEFVCERDPSIKHEYFHPEKNRTVVRRSCPLCMNEFLFQHLGTVEQVGVPPLSYYEAHPEYAEHRRKVYEVTVAEEERLSKES